MGRAGDRVIWGEPTVQAAPQLPSMTLTCQLVQTMSLRCLPGRFSLQRSRPVEVPPNGIVVDASSDGHEEVPDGMGEGDATVAFEEDHAQAVGESTGHQLWEAIPVGLGARREAELSDGHRSIKTKSVTPAARMQAGPSL